MAYFPADPFVFNSPYAFAAPQVFAPPAVATTLSYVPQPFVQHVTSVTPVTVFRPAPQVAPKPEPQYEVVARSRDPVAAYQANLRLQHLRGADTVGLLHEARKQVQDLGLRNKVK
eukprot:TRINITY_DN1999_c0_g1_i1.p1 TRINITY_DN1999_c0_g1~~TRINITY_DN1999_c0_g1_i1.p1  ORF type:complete len:115 (-),score=13.70 TRINITY_DN1999_c0_g1_i1:85-429(-)